MGQSAFRVDFHCHSTSSDGTLTPSALAEHLADRGVAFAALTDHDSLEGCISFREALGRRGVGCVDGMEITAVCAEGELHILGLGVDPSDRALREAVEGVRRHHDPGMQGLVDTLKRIRPRAEQPRAAPLAAADAIRLIHAAGGIAFLAHPFTPARGSDVLAGIVGQLKLAGLDGIEALYAPYSREQQDALLNLADTLGLAVSAGSDFHGIGMPGQSEVGAIMSLSQWQRFRVLLLHVSATPRGAARRELSQHAGTGGFAARVVLPTALALGLFVVTTFALIIPRFETTLLERKKDLIRELTTSVVSVIAEYEADERAGRLTRTEAQLSAAMRIRDIRYGREGKDYFWITDMGPTMIMHPYRTDLNGKDVSGYADANGVRVFVEFVNAVREKSEGYVEYLWQWKDDASRIVPKLSFVKRFAPWDWVIGTGIYLDDVRAEIDAMVRRLVWLFAGMAVLLTILLAFVVQQSLSIERRRRSAEAGLRESHEKYRTLVEASTEGMVMVAAGACVYANTVFLNMVGYRETDLPLLGLRDLIVPAQGGGDCSQRFIAAVCYPGTPGASERSEAPTPCECGLLSRDGARRDVVISASPFEVSGRGGWVLVVRDLSAPLRAEGMLGGTGMSALAREATVGLFLVAAGRRGVLLDANPAARTIFGVAPNEEPRVSVFGLASDTAEADRLAEEMGSAGVVRGREMRITQPGGERLLVRLTLAARTDDSGRTRIWEGMVEDMSARKREERRQEELIAELQTSSLYLSEDVARHARPAVTCSMETTIQRAATLISRAGQDAFLVTSESGDAVGIVTDRDIRERVVARGGPVFEAPVRDIMTAPLVGVPSDALLSEAVEIMRQREIGHLVVRDATGGVAGILRARDLVQLHRGSASLIQHALRAARSVDEVAEQRAELPALTARLLASGAKARHVSRTISAVSDLAVQRLVDCAVAEMGPAPEGYAFLVMGSEGRQEQTGGSDQDNALIFRSAAANQYFLSLGGKVCAWLDGMGVPYCKGGIMASNPAWCVTAAAWQAYFLHWIREPEPAQLLDFNVFFDFRCVAGDPLLADELRDGVEALLGETPAFFAHLAGDLLRKKLPPHQPRSGQTQVDVKDAMAPITGFARLYSLRHGIRATNTLQRLESLRDKGILKPSSADDIIEAWTFLLELRLRLDGSTHVDLRGLKRSEEASLRHALSELAMLHKRILYDFPGVLA